MDSRRNHSFYQGFLIRIRAIAVTRRLQRTTAARIGKHHGARVFLQPSKRLTRQIGRIACQRTTREEQRIGTQRGRILYRGQIHVPNAVHRAIRRKAMPFLIDLRHGEATAVNHAAQGEQLAQRREHAPRVNARGAAQRAVAAHEAAARRENGRRMRGSHRSNVFRILHQGKQRCQAAYCHAREGFARLPCAIFPHGKQRARSIALLQHGTATRAGTAADASANRLVNHLFCQ